MGQERDREPLSKLQMDNPLDFRFHAAYMAYSKAWDENQSEATRAELNELISSLSTGKASYEAFYANLNQFRGQQVEFRRERIQSQRKRDWRQSEKRSARNSRYRK